MKQFFFTLCASVSLLSSLNALEAEDQSQFCMPPAYQTRLQKLYVTSDRIILNDNLILFIDYNNTVQTTPGVFCDQGGLFVFSQEPIYTIQTCPATEGK